MTTRGHHGLMLVSGALTTWDALVVSPAATLAASNTRLRSNSSTKYANSRVANALSGNVYFSALCEVGGSGNNYGFGVADVGVALTSNANYAGAANSVGLWREGRAYHGGSVIYNKGTALAGTLSIEVAVRTATRKVWIRESGGAWIGGGDPAANTTPTATLGGTGALYAAGSLDPSATGPSAQYIQLPLTVADITGTPPSGFAVGFF